MAGGNAGTLAASERELASAPNLPARFLMPLGFRWGCYVADDGALLRWGHLPVADARAECVMVGGLGEFIEMQFETARDLAARGIAVWCLDWRGQGGSARPPRWPARAEARRFDRDAADLAGFAAERLTRGLPRLLIAHSMGGAIALLCLHRQPSSFDAAVLSAPMLGLRIGRLPYSLLRSVTLPLRFGVGRAFVPLARRPRPGGPDPATSRASSDPERCRLRYAWSMACPQLRLGRPTFAWLDATLGVLPRLGRAEFLAAIDTPILLGSPALDIVVASAAQRRASRLLPDCTFVELAGSKHHPFLERDIVREEWLGHIDRFVAARVAR